ncbi:hypothetical protein NDU88_002961 [Pleurodeles waltl]|uniref:Uncharacterized protein n=1 Tax=Pleurodeles waltl TaxID=8319 RepID=A0AAV7T4D3_PLEWA|nr:hypothetical protein NDU88_002961 [Pleurodeles waltl]
MLTTSQEDETEVRRSDGIEPCRLPLPVPNLERMPEAWVCMVANGVRDPLGVVGEATSRPGQPTTVQTALTHGPFRTEGYDIRITADYSKDTNERRKTFLAHQPRLRQLEIKYGLFDPTRMWVTKNGVSNDFYDPEDLRLFLDTF